MKTILIGIDAATWRCIDPLLDDLPNFKKLISDGIRGDLKSIAGHKSPALWTSIATGKVPEKHGVMYFSNLFFKGKDVTNHWLVNWPYRLGKLFCKDFKSPSSITFFSKRVYVYSMLKYGKLLEKMGKGGNLLVTSSLRQEKAVWEMLSESGVSCGVVGWLATWPADKINGVMVSQKAVEGLNKLNIGKKEMVGEGGITFPAEYLDEISWLHRSPESISLSEMSKFFTGLSADEISRILDNNFNKKDRLSLFSYMYLNDIYSTSVGVHLLQKDLDFVTVYLPGLDGMQHVFWQYAYPDEFKFAAVEDKYSSVIDNYYKFLDLQIGKLVGEGNNIIIVSDHGTESINESNYVHDSVRSGEHEKSPDGILVMSGPAFKKGSLDGAHLCDIAPTVLHLMGCPVDSGMDGKVLDVFVDGKDVIVKDYGKRDVGSEFSYSKEEEDIVKERLEMLGYLD